MKGNVQSLLSICKSCIHKGIKFTKTLDELYSYLEYKDSKITRAMVNKVINPTSIDIDKAYSIYKSNITICYMIELDKEKNHYLTKKQVDKEFGDSATPIVNLSVVKDHFDGLLKNLS